MSDALLEPLFQDFFTVLRRREDITNKGRSSLTSSRFPGTMGVVTAASPNDLERLGEYQFQGSALSIVTRFKLRGIAKQANASKPDPQFQPDLVYWSGDYYTVVTVEDYSRYGSGFIQAIAVSQDFIDDAPEEGISRGIMDFSNPANSGLLTCL